MKQLSIKRILILSFLLITFTVVTIILVQQYFWLTSHERERIEQDYLPVTEAMGEIIEYHFNKRFVLLTQVSEEILKTGINADKSQIIPLAIPILNKYNEFKGFIFGAYGIKPIQKIIDIYEKDYLTLVDEHGRLIASSRPELKTMQDLSSTNIFLETKKKNKGIAEYVSLADNRKKIGALYNLENGWKIWISRDIKEMKHVILRSYYYSVLWGILASLIASGAAYLLSIYISKPIVALKNHSKQFASGDLHIPLLQRYL